MVLSEQVKTISQVESALDKIKSMASSFPDAIRSGCSEFTEFRRDAIEGDRGLA